MATSTTMPCSRDRVATRHSGAFASTSSRRRALLASIPLVVVTIAAVSWSTSFRWRLANELPLQCDEIPLLMRFTGLNGVAETEAAAQEFRPSLFSFRRGAMRSVRVPDYQFTVHTTVGFWSNLTLHLFGYSTGAVRSIQVFWSVLAIVAVAWAAWLAVRSATASCLAGWFVAVSPFSLAYGAQARGYAEALALTPLLLISLEYFRRRPDRWLRAVLVFLCALQLSLTVYTMWVYWVLPSILLAVVLVPRVTADRSARRTARAMLILVALGLVVSIGIYTADRWKQLLATASIASNTGLAGGGANLSEWGEAVTFARRFAQHLFVWPVVIPVLALFGWVVLIKSRVGWWGWLILAGIATPFVFALVTGSPGYVRNLAFLLAPVAILAGLAVERGLRFVGGRIPSVAVGGLVACFVLITTVSTSADLERRARAMLFPDWGDVVLSLEKEPETVGPRWMLPCLANHWQINWYRSRSDDEAFLSIPRGGQIEVVMGARHESDKLAIIYRPDPIRGGVHETPLPAYLSAIAPVEVRGNVEVRRWVGTRSDARELAARDVDVPVAIFALSVGDPSAERWRGFWNEGGAYDRDVVTFKSVPVSGGRLQTMILPAGAVRPTVAALVDHLGVDQGDIHVFTLSPLNRHPVAVNAAAAAPARPEVESPEP